MKHILAKSSGETLYNHSIKVADLAKEMVEAITDDKNLISCVVISALFHDIGKCTNNFQKHLVENNFIDYIPHNILSASIFNNFINIKQDLSNNKNKEKIVRSILYHHPTNFRKLSLKENTIDFVEFSKKLSEGDIVTIEKMCDILKTKYKEYECYLSLNKCSTQNDINFSYFVGDNDNRDIDFFIISNIVKFADFIISSGYNIDYFIKGNYQSNLEFIKPLHYDDRFNTQMKFAEECSNFRLSLFETQTGFGKTLMGIKYLLNNNRKGYWVCPRNTIAEGLYKTINNELEVLGLNKEVKVALLLTNEWVYGDDTCDIIVTNIDNFVRPTLKADSNTYSFNMLYCNCIFDEFHEYVDDQALMAIFNIILNGRFKCCGSKTLLLSATPIMNFVEKFKNDVNFKYISYDYEPILSKKIQISFNDKLDVDYLNNKNWFVSVNTVNRSQEVFKDGYVDNIVHARYTKNDLTERLNQMYNEHGKGCNISTSWVATNILSTGIDVSFGNMLVSWPTPERLIQSGGRCNRWGECKEIPTWHITKDNSDFVEKCGIDAFTDKDLAIKFYNHMISSIENNSIISLKDMYDVRKTFYKKEEKYYSTLFDNILSESRRNIKNLNYEYTRSVNNDDVKYISNKCSLRKNNDIQSFFFKVKYDSTEEFTEVMQGDNRIFNLEILRSRESLNYMFKTLNGEICKTYFKHKKEMENIYKKGDIKFWEVLFTKALCSETPFLISNNYYYNKKIGLYRKK